MGVAFSEFLSVIGSIIPGFLGLFGLGIAIGIASSLVAVRVMKRGLAARVRHLEETSTICALNAQSTSRFFTCAIVILGILCGSISGIALGVRHAYVVAVERNPAVQSRIDDGAKILADLVYMADAMANGRAGAPSSMQIELKPWRAGIVRFRPASLVRKSAELTVAYERVSKSALGFFPEKTHFILKRIIPIVKAPDWVNSFGEIFKHGPDSYSRDETATSLKGYIVDDMISGWVKRKTFGFIGVSFTVFMVGALILIALGRKCERV